MNTRLLPREEWYRLNSVDLSAILPKMPPEDVQIVAVEHEGDMIGCLAVLRVVHLEGAWIHPAHRGKAAVMRHLVQGMYDAAKRWAPSWVMAGAADEQMRGLLVNHLGAVQVPMETFIVSLGEDVLCLH